MESSKAQTMCGSTRPPLPLRVVSMAVTSLVPLGRWAVGTSPVFGGGVRTDLDWPFFRSGPLHCPDTPITSGTRNDCSSDRGVGEVVQYAVQRRYTVQHGTVGRLNDD